MNAIRKTITTQGNELRMLLPDEFKNKKVDVVVTSVDEDSVSEKQKKDEALRERLRTFYADFQVDAGDYKFNRDELYDR
jgi:hypothetical protein